ncbi:MAG: ABC transporter permease [Bacteroides sp.]|nr:ABC transporter permease [Bacteroides sp.]
MTKSKNIVWRLLRRNISAGQIAGYAMANLVGLAIVLTAIQFYRDISTVWDDEDSFFSEDYVVISKKVTGLSLLPFGESEHPTRFSKEEIADIEARPWSGKVGEFNSAAFNVYAKVSFGGSSMGSDLFLESIPDDFFDVSPDGWGYEPGRSEYVPLIISKDYLSLYNFGFATSRGMPQVSEEVISMVPLQLSLSGNGRQQWVNARIVGFSSRLNTIAVPEDFMRWANSEFSDSPAEAPSRLIVKLDHPGDPEAESYLEEHGYETAGDRAANGKAAYFLSLVTSVVIAVGLVISLLAFFILLLSIYLLMQKNREKIHELMQLGYTPSQVARYYHLIISCVNVAVLAAALAVMLTGAHYWREPLSTLGVEPVSPWMTVAVGVGLILLITSGNLAVVSRAVRKQFYS